MPIFSYASFISRTWAVIAVSVAIFGTVVAMWMLVYVFQKICDGTLQGNQVLGVLLLVGVMCLFASVVPWLLPPNETVCATRHFMHPLLLVLCFSILLVKSMQLRSMVSIGLGGTVPQVNQLVSLFFMVMVQVVIAAEWYWSTKPIGVHHIDNYPACHVSSERFLLLHIYPCVLVLLAFFYGVSVLNYKHNFNEGRWIAFALIFIIPILAVWLVVHYFSPVAFHDPTVAVAILLIASLLLSVIFVPKMIAIAQQSRLQKTQSNLYSYWPQWNSHKKSWSPQKWFNANNRQQQNNYSSDLYPLYTKGISGGYHAYQPRPYQQAPPPPKYHGPKPSPPYTGVDRFNGLNYTSSSTSHQPFRYGHKSHAHTHGHAPPPLPQQNKFYVYGERIPDPSMQQQQQQQQHQRRYKQQQQQHQSRNHLPQMTAVACNCCSKPGMPKRPTAGAAGAAGSSPKHSSPVAAHPPQFRTQSGSGGRRKPLSRSSSNPSLVEAGCYPGTVIITPDNESYKDEAIWSHKYDTAR